MLFVPAKDNLSSLLVLFDLWFVVCCHRTTGVLSLCFVSLEFIVPLENCSLTWRRHVNRWRAANLDLCSAFLVMEQCGFLSMPYLLWHGAYIYNGHLRGPVTLTPIAKRLAVELSLPVFTTKVYHGLDSNTQPSTCRDNPLTHCATATVDRVDDNAFSLDDYMATP